MTRIINSCLLNYCLLFFPIFLDKKRTKPIKNNIPLKAILTPILVRVSGISNNEKDIAEINMATPPIIGNTFTSLAPLESTSFSTSMGVSIFSKNASTSS